MLGLGVAGFALTTCVALSNGVLPLDTTLSAHELAPLGDVVGIEAILARVDDNQSLKSTNPRALDLVKQGEELLLAFEHARAAAALGEAAALLEPTLSAADFETWTRARTLAAVAWMEAGNADAAKDAFTKLLALHPDVEPDASLLSPAARATFDAARAEVTARGTGTLEVRVTPPEASAAGAGASVVVDGRARGRAPLSVAGLVAGTHRVAVVAPGYERVVSDVRVDRGALVAHDVAVTPSTHRRTLSSINGNAAPQPTLNELRALLSAARLESLVLVDVIREGESETVRALRVTSDAATAAHVSREPVATLAARVDDALARPDASIDFTTTLLGQRKPQQIAAVAPRPAPEDSTWLVVGAVGGGVVLAAAAATAVTIALWPQPTPQRTLAVSIELPAP